MKNNVSKIISDRTLLLVLIFFVLLGVFSLMSPSFLSLQNVLGITQFGAPLALIAIGEALIILLGKDGIDLSLGANLSLTGVFLGMMLNAGIPIIVAIISAVIIGLLLGLLNGYMISYLGFSPMITTLGTMYVFQSLALYITRGRPISGFPEALSWLGHGDVLGIPNQVFFVVIPVTVFFSIMMSRTAFGRKIFLIGSNNRAAELAGLNPKRIRMTVYGIAGALSGLAAVIMVSWLMTSKADAGTGLEMQAITASVLGGFSIKGGVGNVLGAVIAVLILTTMKSGLQIANISTVMQLGVLGALLIFVLIFDNYARKGRLN